MKEAIRRVKEQPLTHAVSLYTLGGGIRLVLTAASLSLVHPYIIVGVGILAALGAALTLLGVHWRGDEPLTGLAIEKVGLVFMGAVWLINGYVLLFILGEVLGVLSSVALGGGILLRARQVHKKAHEYALSLKEGIRQARSERTTNSKDGV